MIALAGIKIETLDWSTLAPLANHLWQSTIFAGTAGLLTLLLRKNRAQTRYWLWLIASAKFLIPFSLLISLGNHLGWSKPASITQPAFTIVMQQIGQPFSPSEPDLQVKPATPRPQTLPTQALVILLTTAWACGSLAVLLAWCVRWCRLMLAMRRALPANTGRELEVLRRLEKARGAKAIGLLSSDAALEPGIVGIVRPVLLLPARISDRLTDAQLEAIMTHELCHVRRRDNMIAALHMMVEAMFWFHPLVWWVGSRLVDERERACDEEVLRMGSDPQDYAEGILKVCKFYLESPLICVAGVTGASLKKRIEEIMMHRIVHQLELKKKLLLAVAGTAAIALPVVFGVLQALAIPSLPLRFLKGLPVKNLAQSRAGQLESTYVQPHKDDAPNPSKIIINPPGSGPEPDIRTAIPNAPLSALEMHTDSKTVYETIGKLAGLNVLFDPDYQPRPLSIKLKNVTLQEALDIVALESRTFWRPVSPNTIFVAADTQTKRREITPDSFLGTNATLTMPISKAYGVNDFQVSGGPAGQLEWIYVQPHNDDTPNPFKITMNPPGPGLGPDFRWTPDSFLATNATLAMVISQAYGVSDFQVSGGPSWIYSQRYDVNVQFAKLEGDDSIHLSSPTQVINHRRLELQSILAYRFFKLAIHRETKSAPIYELVLSASGPNFHEAPPGEGIRPGGPGEIVGQGVPIALLADWLSMQLGREVVDKTMLTGNYDFTLHWPSESASKSTAILAAVPRDLGLQLNPQVGSVEVIVVDHVEQVSRMNIRSHPGPLP